MLVFKLPGTIVEPMFPARAAFAGAGVGAEEEEKELALDEPIFLLGLIKPEPTFCVPLFEGS
jgi:hypothetical protein